MKRLWVLLLVPLASGQILDTMDVLGLFTFDGTASNDPWSFTGEAGQQGFSGTWLGVENTGLLTGNIGIDFEAHWNATIYNQTWTIPANLTFHHGIASWPNQVDQWSTTPGGDDAAVTLPVPPGQRIWIQFAVPLPAIIPDGAYSTSYVVIE